MATTEKTAPRPDSADAHFEFGANWQRFLSTLDEQRVDAAKASLQELLAVENLRQKRFLDAGSGSGLFSLAAHQLGAEVVSFDLDQHSYACTLELKRRFAPDETNWTIHQGSLTDMDFLRALGSFDIVYCWGVAHHTGQMWQVIDNLLPSVRQDGSIVLAIYNDELYISRAWRGVKLLYQKLPPLLRPVLVIAIGSIEFVKRLIITTMASLLRIVSFRNPLTPFLNWARESRTRGMHRWYDLVDWVGGWPFEVAKPEEVFRFLRDRGFVLQELTTTMGHGCNEFRFVRRTPHETPSADRCETL